MVTLRNLPSLMLQQVLNIIFVSLCRNDFIEVMTIATFRCEKFHEPNESSRMFGMKLLDFSFFHGKATLLLLFL